MKAAIVVPTIREESIKKFLEQWRDQFKNHDIIIVEDNPEKSFDIKGPNITHYSWAEIDKAMGDKAWIYPRRTDCIRSFGYLRAFQRRLEMTVTMDDDCYPVPGAPPFLEEHWRRLETPSRSNAWTHTGKGWVTRGIPYKETEREFETYLNHGMWTNVPDYDAVTQLVNSREARSFEPVTQAIPFGKYYPMCGMNLAFRPGMTPAMYFLLMGQGVGGDKWPFDRFGDIWTGVISKKILDHLRLGVSSGPPLVEHQRASNVWKNLAKELPGYEVNETFWLAVDGIKLEGTTFKECYLELAEELPKALPKRDDNYWVSLSTAMIIWANLFP